MNNHADYSTHQNIALITLNTPPVNGLGVGMRNDILQHYQRATSDEAIEAIVIAAKGPLFCAGADINEFAEGTFNHQPHLPDILDLIEASNKPVVAAINGSALGGGLELTLACDYRFIDRNALLGLPEVKLGILPGGGGTQRLPRIVGPEQALEMIAKGNTINAERARQIGLVDEIFASEGNFIDAALEYTQQLINDNAPVKSCAAITINPDDCPATLFEQFRQSIARSSRGFFAPERCIQAIEAACNLPFKEGLKKETALFEQCHNTSQARAQQHIFFAERQSGKIPGIDKSTQARPINAVAVIGAGTMGGGIAMNFANAGIPVTVIEQQSEALQQGLERMRKNYDISASKGKLTHQQVDQRMGTIIGSLDYADAADADLVIEAVFEDIAIKQQVFQQLDKVCKADCIIASNTSTLDIDKLATFTSRPQDVVGLHFFSPANVMRLLEIVRGQHTAADVIVTAIKIGKTINKYPVVAGNCWGFIGNRLLEPYGRETCRLILEGATPWQIDRVLTDFGMAMGYPSMIDLAGIDVGYLTRSGNLSAFAHDPGYAAICNALYSLKRFGQKTGRGFYHYKGREQTPDNEVIELAEQLAAELHIKRRDVSDQEILERTLYTLINEGAQALKEGIAYRASDIDLIYIHGYGFPLWRGGPMQYANETGLNTLLERINHYRTQLGDYGEMWFKPAPLLEELCQQNKTFADFDIDNAH